MPEAAPGNPQFNASPVIERVVARFGERKISSGAGDSAVVAATGFPVRRIVPEGMTLFDFALPVARKAADGIDGITGVIAATFSDEMRFPALSIRIASALGLPPSIAAFDLQMACSAFPYAIYLAGMMAANSGGRVLVVDADIQSHFLDTSDSGTSAVMDDAATATVVSCLDGTCLVPRASCIDSDDEEHELRGTRHEARGTRHEARGTKHEARGTKHEARSTRHEARGTNFKFHSSASEALVCPAAGPVKMDGFKVFSFVAGEMVKFLRPFGSDFDMFVPHRANLYMVRRLAKSLGLEDKLLLAPKEVEFANPGSSSIPATLAVAGRPGRALIAGFGAGLSASAGIVTLPDAFCGMVVD